MSPFKFAKITILTFTVLVLAACATGAGSKLPSEQTSPSAAASVNILRLYQPDAPLNERLNGDVSGLAMYAKAVEKELLAFWEKQEPPTAKGLLLAVGVKPGGKSRFWCEPVDGTIPAETLRALEKQLGEIPAVQVKKGPVAFAMEVNLAGAHPEKFPLGPRSWTEAGEKSKTPLIVPDGVFEVIWPD